MSGITIIDISVVAVVLLSAIFAMWRGLIQETFTIFEWVAAAFVGLRFASTFQPLVAGIISPSWLAWIAAFVGIFLIVFIPLSIFSHRLSEMVKRSEIGPVDRALGLVFGLGRGLVIIGLGYIAFAALVPASDRPEQLTKARLFPLIQNTSEVLLDLVPGTKLDLARTDDANDSQKGTQKGRDSAGKTYGASERSALDRLIET